LRMYFVQLRIAEQNVFGQGSLTGIWVRNNAKSAAFLGGFCDP